MNAEAKRIVKAVASAFAKGWISDPNALRQAAAHIENPAFSAEDDERELAVAFATLFKARADQKERSYREAFGDST